MCTARPIIRNDIRLLKHEWMHREAYHKFMEQRTTMDKLIHNLGLERADYNRACDYIINNAIRK